MKGETFMKELDVVTLKSDFNGVSAGTQGTIMTKNRLSSQSGDSRFYLNQPEFSVWFFRARRSNK